MNPIKKLKKRLPGRIRKITVKPLGRKKQIRGNFFKEKLLNRRRAMKFKRGKRYENLFVKGFVFEHAKKERK